MDDGLTNQIPGVLGAARLADERSQQMEGGEFQGPIGCVSQCGEVISYNPGILSPAWSNV